MNARWSRFWRGARVGFVVVFLLLSAVAGFLDFAGEIRSASTPGQWAATATQLVYGIFAVLALVAMMTRKAWVNPLLVAWGCALTATGVIASVAWGGTSILIGAVAGVSVAAIVGLILWAWRCHIRAGESGKPAR